LNLIKKVFFGDCSASKKKAKMDAEIETCYPESGPNQSEEINFDLISRYYQILLNQAENNSGNIERAN
jgi:hypothetical protein